MNEDPKRRDHFRELMKPWESFFHETPVKGFLQSIDGLFHKPFPLHSSFSVETSETDTEYEIYAELPGINKEQIGIDVLDRSITITVQALEDVTEEDDNTQNLQKATNVSKIKQNYSFSIPDQ